MIKSVDLVKSDLIKTSENKQNYMFFNLILKK